MSLFFLFLDFIAHCQEELLPEYVMLEKMLRNLIWNTSIALFVGPPVFVIATRSHKPLTTDFSHSYGASM